MKKWKARNLNFIALVIWIYVRKKITLRVIGVVMYCFIEKYVCIDYIVIKK